jgi:hypothetical protein
VTEPDLQAGWQVIRIVGRLAEDGDHDGLGGLMDLVE